MIETQLITRTATTSDPDGKCLGTLPFPELARGGFNALGSPNGFPPGSTVRLSTAPVAPVTPIAPTTPVTPADVQDWRAKGVSEDFIKSEIKRRGAATPSAQQATPSASYNSLLGPGVIPTAKAIGTPVVGALARGVNYLTGGSTSTPAATPTPTPDTTRENLQLLEEMRRRGYFGSRNRRIPKTLGRGVWTQPRPS